MDNAFAPGQVVPADQILEEVSPAPTVGTVIPPEDIVEGAAPEKHPLLAFSAQALADDPEFDPEGYAVQHFDALGQDAELLKHLAEADNLRRNRPMTLGRAAALPVKAVKAFAEAVPAIPRMVQTTLETGAELANPELVSALAGTSDDPEVAGTLQREAAANLRASLEYQSQQTGAGLLALAEKVDEVKGAAMRLSGVVAQKVADKVGVPVPVKAVTEAIWPDPANRTVDQRADDFLQKVALRHTIEQSKVGQGPVAQAEFLPEGAARDALALDLAELRSRGVEIDPQVVEDLGLITDVTEFIPAAKGFTVVAKGRPLLSAPTKALAARGIAALRQASASAARKAAGVAKKVSEVPPVVAGAAGAALDGGTGAVGGFAVPRASRFAEAGLNAGAEVLEGTRKLPGADALAAVAGSAPVRGAAKGLVAPLSPELDNTIPLAAALGEGGAEGLAEAVGSTAAFGALGGGTAGLAQGGAQAAQSAARDVVNRRFQEIQREPVQDFEYGTDAGLDAAHKAQMAAVRANDPKAANSLNWLRATALPEGSELYILPKDVFSAQVAKSLGQPEGTQFDTPGFIETRPDGSTRVLLNETTTALGHEVGHALVAAMAPDTRANFLAQVRSAYGPEQLAQFGRFYDAALSKQKGAESELMAGNEDRIVNEVAAEMLTKALYAEPLSNVPPSLGQKIIGGLARLAEATTLYKPQVGQFGQTGASSMGVTPSVKASDTAMEFLRNAQTDPGWMAGPRPPVIPPTPAAAPATPTPAADGMTRREFLSGGIRRKTQPSSNAATAAGTPAPSGTSTSPEASSSAPAAAAPTQPAAVPPVIPPPVIPEAAATASTQPAAVPPVIPEAAAPAPAPAQPATSAERLARLRQPTPPEESQRPQNMRVTPEEQAALDTRKQVTGVVDAERAVQANPTIYDETARKAFADINAALQRPQGQVAPVRLAYRSVTPAQGGAANARVRKGEQDAAYARERDLALQGLPSDVRTLFDKVTIPYRWNVSGDNVNVFAMSLDKVLTNARTVARRAEAAGATDLIPYATVGGNMTPAAAREFAGDLRTYTANQANGYAGSGASVTQPADYRGQIPEVNPNYRPTTLDQRKADFINLLMAISPPATNRVTADARARGSIPNVEAAKLAAANQRPVVQARTADPARNEYRANPAVGVVQPTPITETNPLRDEFARRGVDFTGRNLFQVTENLNLQDIQSVTPAPESGFRAPSKDLIQAGFMPEVPKLADDRTSGKAFKNFFSAVTSGEAKYRPNSPWKNLLPLDAQEPFLREYDKHTGNFDAHIGTSIPGYKDVQVRVGNAVASVYGQGGRVLDIGASEGSWAKTISALSGGRVQTVALDPNPAMANFFKSKSQVPGATYDTRAFREGFEDEGVVIQPFDSAQPFDVVHEAMVFQFISPERAAQLDEVKRLMTPDGVFFAEEKFKTSPEEWAANEDKKDREFKDLFYSRDQLAAKQAVVKFQQDPGETKAVGMVDNMVTPDEFEAQLAARFKHVAQYWDSGNFKGYAASDSAEALARMLAEIGDLNTDFSNTPTPRAVQGGRFMPRVQLKPEDRGLPADEADIGSNYWMSPDGELFRTGGNHNQWAKERLVGTPIGIPRAEFQTRLAELGWVRMSSDRDGGRAWFVNVRRGQTRKQREALSFLRGRSEEQGVEWVATGLNDDSFEADRFEASFMPTAAEYEARRAAEQTGPFVVRPAVRARSQVVDTRTGEVVGPKTGFSSAFQAGQEAKKRNEAVRVMSLAESAALRSSKRRGAATEDEPKTPTGWVLPNGEYIGVPVDEREIYANTGDFHGGVLVNQAEDFKKRFGLKEPDRLEALKKGFVRVRLDGISGRLGIEALTSVLNDPKRRGVVESVIRQHGNRLSRIVVNGFNERGKVTLSEEARVFSGTPEEKVAAFRELLPSRAGAFMPYAGPQADLDARQKDAFDAAKAMDDAGRDPEDIRAATGWFRGKYDDKWRYEVRDDRASLKIDSVQRGPTSLTLGEILDHPDLFAAYPELKRVRAYFSDRLPQGAWAVYNPQTKSITVDSTRIPDERVEQVIPLLLHEVQHWIQEREGFARGSDPQEFDSEDLQMSPEDAAKDEALTEEWDRLQEEHDALKESMSKIPESERGMGTPIDRMAKRQERIEYLQRNLAEQSRAIRRPYIQARAEEAYRNSAGEIEARDVEFRRRWSPKRRAEVPPYTSEGIPKERAGVYFMPAAPVGSEAFKQWFAGSAFANPDGSPIEFYHGTKEAGFTEFDGRRRRKNAVNATFFTDRFSTATTYSGTRKGVQLPPTGAEAFTDPEAFKKATSIEIVREVGESGNFEGYTVRDAVSGREEFFGTLTSSRQTVPHDEAVVQKTVVEYLDKNVLPDAFPDRERGTYSVYLSIPPEEVKTVDFEGNNWDSSPLYGTTESAARDAYEEGYRALRILNVVDSGGEGGGEYSPATVVAVFDAMDGSVKSADQNRGTYDRGNPDIRFMPAAPVGSEAFKAWFGDSVVVNPDGSPKVVVHTTDAAAEFYTFRTKTPKDIGAHFGAPEQAEDRIRYKTEMRQRYPARADKDKPTGGLRSLPVFIRLENPLRLPDLGSWTPENMRLALAERFPEYAAGIRRMRTTREIQKFLNDLGYDGLVYRNTGESMYPEEQARLRSVAEEAYQQLKTKLAGNRKGYFSTEDQRLPEYKRWSDAMEAERTLREGAGAADSYAVFDPEQVKSAIGNAGTFDERNPDIRFMPRPESPARLTRADIDRNTLPPGQAQDLDSWVSTRIPWAKGYEDEGYNKDLVVGTEDVFEYTPAAKAKLNASIKDIPGMGDLKGRFEDVVYQFRDRLVDNLLMLHDAMPGDFRNRARLWYDGARVLAEEFAKRYGVRTDQAAAVLATLSPQKDWYQNVHMADMVLEAVTQHQNTRLPEAAAEWVRQKIGRIPAEAEKTIRKTWPEERKAKKRADAVESADKLRRALAQIEGRTLAETDLAFRPFWVRAFWERDGKRPTPSVTPEGTVLNNVPTGWSTAWQSYGVIAKAIDAVSAPDRRRISELVGEMHKVRNFYNNILLPALELGDITVDTHAIAAALMLPYPSSAPAVSAGLGSKGGQDATSGSQGLYGVYADAYRIAAARRGVMARQMQSITWEALRGIYLPKSRAKGSPVRQSIESLYRERAKSGGSVADAVNRAIEIAGGFRLPSWFTGVTGYVPLPDWRAGRTDTAVVDNESEDGSDEE